MMSMKVFDFVEDLRHELVCLNGSGHLLELRCRLKSSQVAGCEYLPTLISHILNGISFAWRSDSNLCGALRNDETLLNSFVDPGSMTTGL